MSTFITPTLDKIEDRLPPIPKGLFKLNRTLTRAWFEMVGNIFSAVSAAGGRVTDTATTATRTVAGQARAEAEQAADAVSTGAKTVAGQARAEAEQAADAVATSAKTVAGQAEAQAERTADAAREEALRLIESAEDSIDPGPSGAYETWTRSELYERARELDIEGRSGMKKAQLVEALRS